jgi:cob(I)alamin adenosyltransferase
MIQFMKEKGKSGEQRICPEVVKNIEIYPFGMGFVFRGDDIRPHMEIAEKAWFFMEEILSQKRYHILILDEIAATINLGLLPVERVEELIKRMSSTLHVIITGRDVPEELIKMADIVTVMHEAKHIYKEGVGASRGIDF